MGGDPGFGQWGSEAEVAWEPAMAIRLIAGLLAGVAPTGLRAQEATPSVAPARPAPDQMPPAQAPVEPASPGAEPAQEAPPREPEFTAPDGSPLPPEIQRELERHLRDNPLPVASPGARRRAGGTEIVVTGQRPRGSVIGDVPPERTFSPLDIRAYGASNLEELLQAVGPQVRSNRGRENGDPVVLLNGRRISSFAEIAAIPAEAIERMEVFPEELSLQYGYRADQKIVNVVTLARFSSRIGQLTYLLPTEGGRDTIGANANYFHIRNDTRFNFTADYQRSGSLLERERDVRQMAGAPDLGRFRTLLPQTERFALNGTVSGHVLGNVSSTLNGRFEASRSEILLGLGNSGPLTRDTDASAIHLGTSLNGAMGRWLWAFTGNYDRISTDTFTAATDALGGRDEARSVNSLANAELVLSGAVLTLPAGPVSTTLRGGIETRDFSSRSLRGGVDRRAELSRERFAIQANFNVPIAGGREESTWLGTLSANANVEIEELSDLGTLRSFGYGLSWSPVERVNLIMSVTNEESAPTVEQLGAPFVVTPNVRTFDFTRREAVDVTRVFGGNPDLRADDRHMVRIGIDARPFPRTELTLSIDYVATRIDDPIAPFPIATPEIEAAFPERFTRDAEGRLLRIDSRPLNFRRSDQERLRWGIDFTRPLGAVPPSMENVNFRYAGSEGELQRTLPPGARIIRAEAGSAAARRFENMSSRLILGFYHTWHMRDEILVRDDVPVLDLLDGSAIDSRGGRSRHELEFRAGAFRRGLGARLTATWRSGTTVRGLPAGSGGTAADLSFSDQATVNVSLFANLADRFGGSRAPQWLQGMRVSIGINNLFDSRPEVRDETGATPLSYQPAYLDPLGRVVSFSVRKAF